MKGEKLNLLLGLLLLPSLLMAQKSPLEPWQDPEVNEVNRMAAHTDFVNKNEWRMSLHGVWGEMPIPGMWEMNGLGEPMYCGIGYEWKTWWKSNPPALPDSANYSYTYVRNWTVPRAWKGRDVILHIGSVTSCVEVWCNGKYVGYGEDSKLEQEFDLTRFVRFGKENDIKMLVRRWCDGSYMEDQDFFRYKGFARETYLAARTKRRIEDVKVEALLNDDFSEGKVKLDVKTKGKVKWEASIHNSQISATPNPISVNFDRQTGFINHLSLLDGTSLLKPGAQLRPNFWRAPTDNDYGAKLQRKHRAWLDPKMTLTSFEQKGQTTTTTYELPDLHCRLYLTYNMEADGSLSVTQRLQTDSTHRAPDMFRFGMQMQMPHEMENITYYGRGPWENYQNRRAAARLGIYHQTVTEQFHPYVRPQENGTKTDVYPTVNYYVQQLFGQNHGDTYLFNVVSGTETASCVRDSKTGTVTVKLANPTDSIVSINVNLSGVKLKGRTATITTLQGERDYKNGQGVHLDTDVKPTVSQERLPKCFKRELPPYSFTVITY